MSLENFLSVFFFLVYVWVGKMVPCRCKCPLAQAWQSLGQTIRYWMMPKHEKSPFATTVRYSPKPWSIPFLIFNFILPPLLSSDIYLVKDGKPSYEKLQYLARELAGKWKTLGRRLGFNEAVIDDLDQANEELAEKAYKMLIAWKQKVGSEATYKVLYDTLCHELVECKHLAEQYCCDKILGNASP